MPCALIKADLHVCKGGTFTQIFLWAADEIIYKPITGITKAAPPVITSPNHELVDQWPSAVASVVGMTGINAGRTPPRDKDYHYVTVLSGDTLSFDDVNALDFDAYKSGGTLIYYKPQDLSAADAYLVILDKEGGTELQRLTVGSGITIDNTVKTITAFISDIDTDAMTFKKAYYILFGVVGTVVTALFEGIVTMDNLIL